MTIASWTPNQAPALFILESESSMWTPQVQYYLGNVVAYKESMYRCIHSHVAQPDWTPVNAPILWESAAVSALELASRGPIAVVVDTADAILDLFAQIEAQTEAALNDPDLSEFEKSLYEIVPDLRAFICFLNGRVPLSAAEGDALQSKILNNAAIKKLEELSDAGATAAEVRAFVSTLNPVSYEFPLFFDFNANLTTLNDGDTVPGVWNLAATKTLPVLLGSGRMLGFWKTLGGIALAVVGVAVTAIGVVKAVACGPCGIPAIMSGVSTFLGGLAALGVNVPVVDGGGFQVTCTPGSTPACTVSPSGIRLGGVD